jgi:hypothetical protein
LCHFLFLLKSGANALLTTTANTAEASEQIQTGRITEAGEAEPAARRKAKRVVGKRQNGAVLRTVNVIISSLASPVF